MDIRRADGMVLLTILFMTLLLSAIAASLVLVSSSQSAIAWNFQAFREARYAAAAAAERAVAEMGGVDDWTLLIDGSIRSTFVDRAPSATRSLVDGRTIDLDEIVNQANCRQAQACSAAQLTAISADRPWGANNPRWRLFSCGWLRDLLPAGRIDSSYYTVVLVGDDEAEGDGDASRDSDKPNPGAGVVELRAMAFGPRAVSRSVEVTVARSSSGVARIVSWREPG